MSAERDDFPDRFLAGDADATGQVLRWMSQVLASASFWSLRGDWQDLLQDAMRRLLESLRAGRFETSLEFRAYAQGVARKTALKALTRRIQAPPPVPDGEEDLAAATDETGDEAAVVRQQLARQVLEAATEECRGLFVAYFIEGRDYEEIAKLREMPVGTVKSRIFRCLETANQIVTRRRGARRRPGTEGRAEPQAEV